MRDETACAEARERLPWLASGALDSDERAAVEAHLEGCATCRSDLADTRRALWIASRHLPAELLADYGAGLALGAWPRELVEAHLGHCADCRADLALDDEAVVPAIATAIPRRRPASAGAFRALASAAALVAALSGGWLVGRLSDRAGEGRASAESRPASLVELEPESARTRTAGESPTATAGPHALVLLLRTDLVADGSDFRLRIERSDGTLLHDLRGLALDRSGGFVVVLDASRWPEGELELEVEAADASAPGGYAPFERYRLRLDR